MQENDPCFTQTPALPQEMCGPHLKCERSVGSSQAFCKPLNTPCENARKADLGFLQKPPECDAEGNFKPTQVSLIHNFNSFTHYSKSQIFVQKFNFNSFSPKKKNLYNLSREIKIVNS